MEPFREDAEALKIKGLRVRHVFEIADADGEVEALQVVFMDGSSLVITVWTDWSMRVERRSDSEIPEYLWPTEERVQAAIEREIPEDGVEVHLVQERFNEIGWLVGVEIKFSGFAIVAESWAGNLSLTVC
ncbi:hypothetical protein ABTY61_28820 [Kitasatospora sp. NPDC096128]|uniref:hypothetical protein n=1 Tax=Kitasatospora sp. NPDC096128 TaxID=3155547 RepID=UPI003332183F